VPTRPLIVATGNPGKLREFRALLSDLPFELHGLGAHRVAVTTGGSLAELARSGMRFHRMSDRCARRDAAVPAADLVAAVRDNATNPWRPPGGGYEGALIHDVIHGLDITVPLGVDRPIPAQRLRTVLDGVTKPGSRKHFGVDLTGIELRADDLDWSFGTGTTVSGPARDLALLLCGRAVPLGRLAGTAAGRFSGGESS